MANVVTTQVLVDGPRNAVVKLTGLLDTSNEAYNVKVNPALFSGGPSGFRIDYIDYSISDGIEVQLFWDATSPSLIQPISGRGRMGFANFGGLQNSKASGWTGAIGLTAEQLPGATFTAGEPFTYSLVLELVKQY